MQSTKRWMFDLFDTKNAKILTKFNENDIIELSKEKRWSEWICKALW